MQNSIYLTGIQSTGNLHLGNLLGAIKNIEKFKNEKLFIMAADLHSLTTQKHLNKNYSLDILRYFHKVCPKGMFYIQSDFSQITYLNWILANHTGIGKLNQMTQYKDKKKENNNCGLLTYPILMSADVGITGANYIPVGLDQSQHLEFTRDIFKKFNNQYGNIFPIPKTILSPIAKVYDLQNPQKKMSKSNGSKGTIYLNDTPKDIQKKIKSAKTDSLPMPTYFNNKRPEINKLITLYCHISEKKPEYVYKKFGNSYISAFKEELSYQLIKFLKNYQPILNREDMQKLLIKQKPLIQKHFDKMIERIKKAIFIKK